MKTLLYILLLLCSTLMGFDLETFKRSLSYSEEIIPRSEQVYTEYLIKYNTWYEYSDYHIKIIDKYSDGEDEINRVVEKYVNDIRSFLKENKLSKRANREIFWVSLIYLIGIDDFKQRNFTKEDIKKAVWIESLYADFKEGEYKLGRIFVLYDPPLEAIRKTYILQEERKNVDKVIPSLPVTNKDFTGSVSPIN